MADFVDTSAQKIGFILLPGFPLMSYASAVEPLRAANLMARRDLYRLEHFAPDGLIAISSSGAEIRCRPLPLHGDGLSAIFICAGGNPADWNYPSVRSSLRALAKEGVRVGGISGGPYVMAAAGLLAGYSFTLHWEHLSAFREEFPDLAPIPSRFVLDGPRITCGGGVAPLDMMHALILEDFGPEVARQVSDWFLHADIAASTSPQRSSLAERYRVYNHALLKILAKMEATVERPLGREVMAQFAGLSSRHVNRLFAEHMTSTYRDEYRRIRLAHAQRLLRQSALSISEISFATGFSSPAHFSRSYRDAFGQLPSRLRQHKPTP